MYQPTRPSSSQQQQANDAAALQLASQAAYLSRLQNQLLLEQSQLILQQQALASQQAQQQQQQQGGGRRRSDLFVGTGRPGQQQQSQQGQMGMGWPSSLQPNAPQRGYSDSHAQGLPVKPTLVLPQGQGGQDRQRRASANGVPTFGGQQQQQGGGYGSFGLGGLPSPTGSVTPTSPLDPTAPPRRASQASALSAALSKGVAKRLSSGPLSPTALGFGPLGLPSPPLTSSTPSPPPVANAPAGASGLSAQAPAFSMPFLPPKISYSPPPMQPGNEAFAIRAPRGPPSGEQEFADGNFAKGIRRKAIERLGALSSSTGAGGRLGELFAQGRRL